MNFPHTDIINKLIKSNNLKSYCEIGVFDREHNFNKVECDFKYCIDPDPKAKADFVGTSDDFFKKNTEFFDLFFLDGLHHSAQLLKDIDNSLVYINEGGFIVVHDLLPTSEKCQHVPRLQNEWTGDCWLAWVLLRATRQDLIMYTLDTDYGIGIIQEGSQQPIEINENITYQNFEKNKKEWLNLVPVDFVK